MAQAEEAQAPLLQAEEADADWSSRPRRIALFVEPSPFASVHASSQAFSCWSD
jgi:sulfoquinovosyltransferase